MGQILKVLVNVIVAALPIVVTGLGIVGVIFLFRGDRDPARRARLLKRIGMGVMAAFALFFGSFAIGETIADPGGWKAVGLVSTWLVPLVVVGVIAWFRPIWGVPLLTALITGVLALEAWAAFDVRIRELEDRIGPFTMVALVAVAIAIAVLGHSRPKRAGIMLLITGLAPFLLAALGTVGVGPTVALYAIVGAPMVLTGIFFVMSDRIAPATPPDAEEAPGLRGRQAA